MSDLVIQLAREILHPAFEPPLFGFGQPESVHRYNTFKPSSPKCSLQYRQSQIRTIISPHTYFVTPRPCLVGKLVGGQLCTIDRDLAFRFTNLILEIPRGLVKITGGPIGSLE